MEFLAFVLHTCLSNFYFLFNSWGLSILGLTVVIRVLLIPTQLFNLSQQRKLRRLQPRMDQLNVQFKSDPMQLFKESARLRKTEGVRPALMLLLTVLPMPIFLSMYRLFHSMPAFTGVSFLWLANLAAPDALLLPLWSRCLRVSFCIMP